MTQHDEDERPAEPPAAGQVARRALVLRHEVEHALGGLRLVMLEHAPPEVRADRPRVAREVAVENRRRLEALRAHGLWEEMSDAERGLVETPADALDPSDVMQAGWRAESLGCLLWALGLVDAIPPYDAQVDPPALLARTPGAAGVDAFLAAARLRARAEIEAARGVAELWHWRSRTRQLEEEGHPFPPLPPVGGRQLTTWDDVVRLTAPRVAASGRISSVIDEDFAAFGRAYRDLTAEEWARARSIAMERHHALNWLCGYAPGNRWDDTPTGT